MRPLTLVLISLTLLAPVPHEAGTTPNRLPIADALIDDLSDHLANPSAFAERVRLEAGGFPEGELFSRVLPAYGLVSVARRNPGRAAELLPLLEVLIEQAVQVTAIHMGHNLATLDSYGDEATWLGHLGVALGGYHLVGGERFVAERIHIAEVLSSALSATEGAPLVSYPGLTWSYDTTPALLAVHLDDGLTGESRALAQLDQHLAWLQAHADPATGLPHSRISDVLEGPRGCDLSLRIGLLAQMDRSAAKQLYTPYVEHFWTDGAMAGFREHPRGVNGRIDNDSGPIINGIGMAATGNGIAAVRAVGDLERHERLGIQLATVPLLVMAASGQSVPGLGTLRISSKCRTGFLFGDMALTNAAAWEDWGVSRPALDRPAATAQGEESE